MDCTQIIEYYNRKNVYQRSHRVKNKYEWDKNELLDILEVVSIDAITGRSSASSLNFLLKSFRTKYAYILIVGDNTHKYMHLTSKSAKMLNYNSRKNTLIDYAIGKEMPIISKRANNDTRGLISNVFRNREKYLAIFPLINSQTLDNYSIVLADSMPLTYKHICRIIPLKNILQSLIKNVNCGIEFRTMPINNMYIPKLIEAVSPMHTIYKITSEHDKKDSNTIEIQSNLLKMARRINALADYHRLETGSLILSNDIFTVKDLMKNVEKIVDAIIHGKNTKIHIRINNSTKKFMGDFTRLTHIIINTLEDIIESDDNPDIIRVSVCTKSITSISDPVTKWKIRFNFAFQRELNYHVVKHEATVIKDLVSLMGGRLIHNYNSNTDNHVVKLDVVVDECLSKKSFDIQIIKRLGKIQTATLSKSDDTIAFISTISDTWCKESIQYDSLDAFYTTTKIGTIAIIDAVHYTHTEIDKITNYIETNGINSIWIGRRINGFPYIPYLNNTNTFIEALVKIVT